MTIVVDNGIDWIEYHFSTNVSVVAGARRDVTFTSDRPGDLLYITGIVVSINHLEVSLGPTFVNTNNSPLIGTNVTNVRQLGNNIHATDATLMGVGIMVHLRRSHS